ncbi:MAG: hypothetical protein HFG37_08550 [Eubacterium sp.]|nr:hypothetical protein [Eubacterium sp.]
MLFYYNEIVKNDITYSIDMVRLRLDFSSLDHIEQFGGWLSKPYHIHIEQYPLSSKAFSYRYLFKIKCNNDSSFVCGLGFNGTDRSSGWIGFLEFNPNKVVDTPEFREFFKILGVHCPWAELVRYDIAIDVPVARSYCSMAKDKRKYTVVQNSAEDTTEYLGIHNKSGFCKLYNKKLESDLDHELTRFEITVNGDLSYSEVIDLFPIIDVMEFQQDLSAQLSLNDTQIVLVDLLKRLPVTEQRYYFNRLGRKMRDKISPYVFASVDPEKLLFIK